MICRQGRRAAFRRSVLEISGDSWTHDPDEQFKLIARESGQFLTLVFHPEGFDFYDLSGLEGLAVSDPAKVRKISHRSPAWKEYFKRLHGELDGGR